MLKLAFLQPNLILGDTVFGITPDILNYYQLKGLVLDVDETLVPLREKKVSEELVRWIAQIRQIASIWLVSNNLSQYRIGHIAQSLNVPYILGAGKPSRRKLRQALQAMNLPASEVAMVGDRIFTDTIAGNRLGMFTILVEPMVDPAIAARSYPIRNLEVWISKQLGVSWTTNLQNFTKNDNGLKKEI
jgi:hypothetical protein